MGGNGVNIFCNGYYDPSNFFLGRMSDFYTRQLRWNPACIWNARNTTQAWNVNTYYNALPYSNYYNYTGTPRYIVSSQYDMPLDIAYRMHGVDTNVRPNPIAVLTQISNSNLLAVKPKMYGQQLGQISSVMSQVQKDECMADQAELKKEAKVIEEQAKALAEELDKVMKNEENLSAEEQLAKVDAIGTRAAALETKGKEVLKKYETVRKAYEEKLKKKAEEDIAAAQPAAEQTVDETVDTEAEDEVTNPAGEGAGQSEFSETVDPPSGGEEPPATPPEVTPALTSNVINRGTTVKVKLKSSGEELTGTFREYDGRIYDVNGDTVEDITDEVEKITT